MILDRRRFLSALGLGSAGLALGGFPRALGGDELPKRLIVVSSSHGTAYNGWKMRPGGEPEDGSWELDLSSMDAADFSRALEPLFPHRDRMLCLDGLSMTSAERDISGYRHEKGWVHAWTGDWVLLNGSDVLATAPSLDQLVAREIARPDRIPSLELSIQEGRPICHAGKAQQLPLEEDPLAVHERMFGLAAGSAGTAQRRKSILDFARGEYDAIAPKLAAGDRAKLGQHFDLVRGLERRLAGLAEMSCEGPRPNPGAWNYQDQYKAMVESVAAAFTCDVTRVASLSLGDVPPSAFGWGDRSGDAHNDFAHQLFAEGEAMAAMTDYTRFHAAQIAHLVDTLSSIPEGDGSVRDNTLIVWGNELGDGWHGYRDWPAVVIGGSWHFRTGRYMHWPKGSLDIDMLVPNGFAASGLPHNHLLTSVAQAMGLATDAVGIRELSNTRGDRFDITGPLPGLT